MIKNNSLGNRLIALLLSIVMVLGMLPVNAIALELTAVAQIGDVTYDTLAEALAAVLTGTNQVAPAEATTVKLLKDTAYSFNVGTSNGSTTMNLKLDLNGNTLTLKPGIGSDGTEVNGIRVLAYSKLEIANGTIVCSSDAADKIKVGIANYSQLTLDSVELKAGDQTIYTVNNRGALTLKGDTSITAGSTAAVTNDPYNLYYTSNVDASLTCDSSSVYVENVLVERYDRNSANQGGVKLNISAGYIGQIKEDGEAAVDASYSVTGGVIGVSSTEELQFVLGLINAGAEYNAPENPVTIQLRSSISGSFDVGTSNGKAPKNIKLDLNGNTLTLKPGIGSDGTEVNGIRVLAYSKLEIANGSIVCSSDAADKIKVGIANYSQLTLDGVELKAGDQTIYTVNNRGALTLKGDTSITAGSTAAVTNDPYNLYYTTDVDASLTCDSSSVYVESVLVELYDRNSTNQGVVKLDISAGYFGEIKTDGESAVDAEYSITGGSFGSDISDFCDGEHELVQDGEGNFVVKTKQENFGFVKDQDEITYGQEFTIPAVQNAVGNVTYFVENGDAATITTAGELTILKAGTVKIKAEAEGNDQYSKAEDTYTLVIHPAYATVSSFSGGAVTGSGEANTEVRIDNAVLEWVAKDDSIGRSQDGWWVGIKIVAPEGVDLSKAVYQRRSGGTYDNAEVKPFVPESDRYMGMWGLITAEYLESFSNAGKKLNYVWRFSWDGDDVYEQTIAITIDPAGITLKQSGFAFDVTEDHTTYGEDYIVRVPSGGQGATITYSTSDITVAEFVNGELVIKQAGEVEIIATKSGDYYQDATARYKLIIDKAEQTGFKFDAPSALTWQEAKLGAFALVNDKGDGAVTWEVIAGNDVATVDADGKIKLLKAGTFTLQVKKAESDCYKEAKYSAVITVNKAEQTGFGFDDPDSITVTYNDNGNAYPKTATGGQVAKDVVYSVLSGDAAIVDAATGVVTIDKAGTVVIQAVRPGNDQYAEAVDTYTLIIEKAAQSFEFDHDAAITKTYGLTSFATKLTPSPFNSGVVTYACSDNVIGATVDNNGVVTFGDSTGKLGAVTVTVTLAEDERYKECTKSYTITISEYEAVPNVAYSLDGDKLIEGSEWFTGDVTISAPEGYDIAYTNELVSTVWADFVVWDKDGQAGTWTEGNKPVVYLKNETTGAITNAIFVADLKRDTQDPINLSISYDQSIWEIIGEKLFGFHKETVEVTVTATDAMSGISKMEYSLDNGSNYTEIIASEGKYIFSVPAEYRGQIWLRATDVAGRTEVFAHKVDNRDQILVVDSISPEIFVSYEAVVENGAENTVVNFPYNKNQVKAIVTINEKNFFEGMTAGANNDEVVHQVILKVTKTDDNGVVTVTEYLCAGAAQTVTGADTQVITWSHDGDIHTTQILLDEDGDYVLELSYQDFSNNGTIINGTNGITYTSEKITVDTTDPKITVSYNDVIAKNGNCYKDNRVATIVVEEHNFDADKFNLLVTAKDILDDVVTDAYTVGQWRTDVNNSNIHILEVTFKGDANFTFSGSCTDLAGNTTNFEEPDFVVDHTKANNIKIEYSKSIAAEIIESLSFGFYQAEVVVTVTAEDMTSGVDYFVLSYTRDKDATDAHKGDFTTEKLYAQPGTDAKTFTASYTVPAQARGSYKVAVYDRAGNDSYANDEGTQIVTDTVASNVKVEYTDLENVNGLRDNNNNVVAFENATKFYYNEDVTAKITIEEANFFEGKKAGANNDKVVHQVILKVTKTDDNGKVTVTEYLCAGAAQTVAGAQTKIIEWTTVGDTHTVEIDFTDNGDYVLELRYQDFSGNNTAINGTDGNSGNITYVSKTITVDKVAPKIDVSYNDVTAQNGNCYKDNRVATITVEEHNFKAEEFNVNVTAKDIFGNAVAVMDYAAYAKDPKNWTRSGNINTLELTFSDDAIYTLSGSYTDLAGNSDSFEELAFVVDHTAAGNIKIEYSESVIGKVIEALSFGFYKREVVVTVTAEDMTSGVDYFELTYTRDPNATDAHTADFTKTLVAQAGADAKTFTASYTVPAQARGSFSVKVVDRAGNESQADDHDSMIVADTVASNIKVEYTNLENANGFRDENNNVVSSQNAVKFYYNKDVTAKITIEEANFFEGKKLSANDVVHQVILKVTKTDDNGVVTVKEYLCAGAAQTVTGAQTEIIEWTTVGDTHSVEITFAEDGDYVLELNYQDFSGNDAIANGTDGNSGNTAYTSRIITVDKTDPTINISYNNAEVFNGNCYKTDRVATITVVEHNFKAEEFNVAVTARDIFGKSVAVMDYAAYAKDPNNWVSNGNTHTLSLTFSTDAIYTFGGSYADLAGNFVSFEEPEFVVDHTAASNIKITYSTPFFSKIIETLSFGFYKADVVVTVTAEDMTSGVDYFVLTYTRDPNASDAHAADFSTTLGAQPGADAKTFTASYTMPAQARGNYSVQVVDRAGNNSQANDYGSMIVADTVSSNVKVEYTELSYANGFRDENNNIVSYEEAAKFYYNKAVTAKITIEEANFFEGKKSGASNDGVVHQVILKVTKTDDNGKVTVTEYLCEGAALTVAGAQRENIQWTTVGDTHFVEITFADNGDYVLELNYQDFSGNDASINGTDGNIGNVTYASRIITVDKAAPVIGVSYNEVTALNGNCYKDNRVATITVEEHNFKAEEFVVNVTAEDIFGNDVAVMDYAAYAKDPKNWSRQGNVNTLELTFSDDAVYKVSGSYIDLAGNTDSFDEPEFVVDHTAASNIQITYSTPIFSAIIEKLTFGFYKADVVVTVTAEDMTSGVDYFELTYTRDPNASDAHTASFMQTLEAKKGADAKTFTASYTVPAEARGSYSVKVFDRAGNVSQADDNGTVIITDTVDSKVQVEYAAMDSRTQVSFLDSNRKNVETFEEAANAFFDGDVAVTITIDEANFFEGKQLSANDVVHQVILKVTKTDDNGKVTVTEYLWPTAALTVEGAERENILWSTVGDTHTVSIAFEDDGDYVLELSYQDFSGNNSQITGNDGVVNTNTYTSKVITVDETAPVIDVTYGNTEVINTIDGRDYFDKTQSAVIAVTEHNFRAEDIAAVVTAKNFVGANVAVADFAAQLADERNWKHEGNVHTAEIQYTVDANYTFDIAYKDLAKTPATFIHAEQNDPTDYKMDLFTVDTTAPKNLEIKYSQNIFEVMLDKLFFGYYNTQMTVEISATDDVSGINYFIYSYLLASNVSSVNAQEENVKIEPAKVEGNRFTASFKIPTKDLNATNQFNGSVKFTAYDRSEKSTGIDDAEKVHIIVDSIAPKATITYNAPVQNANNISYYNGNINATIVVNEANFDTKDTTVVVTKDGVNYPVNVAWRNDSVDIHTGTFTLTEDGDYIVTVQSRDKSNNQMATYTSNQLTLDTAKPTIHVSNVKNNSANKDEKYGFVITVNDTNLDVSSLAPSLKAVQQKEEGNYVVVDVDLGEATTVVDGQTYTYTVEDLPEDGFYTLICSAQDMATNAMDEMILDDEQSYAQVQFSINRNGSTFGYGNAFSEELVGKYYIYSVDEDVVIVEVNVDPIEAYKVTLNGNELVEGTDYTTTQTSENGEWSKRTYVIKKALFETEGEYNIVVSSVDKTETTAFSDVKHLTLAFVVDQTAPVLTITGLEAGGRYQTDEQIVTLMPTDEGGRLNSLSVVVMDSNGNALKDASGADISVRFEMSGEELLKYLEDNDGKVVFTVPEGLNNQVRIVCTDCAVNADNEANEYNELFERVTVSQSQFVIFYANTPLFLGSIVGTLSLTALIVYLIKRRVRK